MITPVETLGAILSVVSFILVVNLYARDSTSHIINYPQPQTQTDITINTQPTTYTSGFVQWAGIDHSVALVSPVNDILPLSLDSKSRVFPAAELHGSLYMPEGNIILGSDSNIYIGADTSILGLLANIAALQCAVCKKSFPCCPQTATMNVSTCDCDCNDGFTGPACTTESCFNGGNWSDYTQQCTCPYPYTPETRCSEAQCGPNSFLSENGVCLCISPFTGPACNVVSTTVNQINLSFWNQTGGTPRSNWGVADCFGNICVCPPLYQPQANTVIERQMECLEQTCTSYFAMVAPYCCTETVRCEEISSLVVCRTQPCCNYKQTPAICMATLGCLWNHTTGCTLTQIKQHRWSKSVLDCTAIQNSNNLLCQDTVAQEQAFYYYNTATNRADAYVSVIQHLAWQQISQYDIWDDGISHSIVASTSQTNPTPCQTAWRLALLYDNPSISSTLWTCGTTNLVQTGFTFELINNATSIPGPLLGSVYRVWAANSLWCLLGRSIYQDEQYIYGYSTIGNATLVAIDIASPAINAGKNACGLFVIQDGAFSVLNSNNSLNIDPFSGLPVLSPQLNHALRITTPPVNIDYQKLNPTPLRITGCRFVQCQIPLIRGYCSTYSCAETVLGQSLFAQCLPCLQAHVVLDPSV